MKGSPLVRPASLLMRLIARLQLLRDENRFPGRRDWANQAIHHLKEAQTWIDRLEHPPVDPPLVH